MCLVRLVLTTYFHGNKIYVASVKGHMEALMQSLHASENMHDDVSMVKYLKKFLVLTTSKVYIS